MPDQLRVALSTSSVYPGSTASGFETAARLGYDGVEVMVSIDDVSGDVEAVKSLSEFHEVPIVSVHAPCLLLTQRVWGTEPWGKLHRSAEMALEVGAETVVVHPPFRWQREYARGFVDGIADLEHQYGITFAVENMYPWRTGRREFQAYAPGWDPLQESYAHVTVDLSHSATAGEDALQMAKALGGRLAHIHLTDGSGSPRDEHLVPGHGEQPAQAFLEHVAASDYTGEIVVEINTRKAVDQETREADLLESLAFARLHASR
ncbi:sugar phosphate isomerase/epimerase family protein [Aeromicrobium terrae]|uniref:Sugar phosphate isomerase/epimerase n=1 Tax=Aeromicrobium terrae TaxID=2498846 RepID=A0A5C8NGJ3_9ACTN|nr:sugar phosphate isomerase/epimerase family protein [Aeromicrobium terrae]TXL57935.1 sugar phosphate isomerase/epimerase [Aeromicrobium terrae]